MTLLATPDELRLERAELVKRAKDVRIPHLRTWNYEPCARHEKPDPDCEFQACGGEAFSYQRVGAMWMLLRRKGVLADDTGLGKMIECALLLALLKERVDGLVGRALVVCGEAAAVPQWLRQLMRFAPGLKVEGGLGTKAERLGRYAWNWDVLVVSAGVMLRDVGILQRMAFNVVIADDIDPLRNHTQTATLFNRLAGQADYVVNAHATPMGRKPLEDLYRMTWPVGGFYVFGAPARFQSHYVRTHTETGWTKGRRKYKRKVVDGYQNVAEFRTKFEPMILRRRYEDVDDVVDIPDVAPVEEVWLQLLPAQHDRYRELKKGIVQMLKEGVRIRREVAEAQWMYGAMICSGLQNLGELDVPAASVKLNWLQRQVWGWVEDGQHVPGPWADEKVVVFSRFRGMAQAVQQRFEGLGVGCALTWGDMSVKAKDAAQQRFWDDPDCRVFVGTTTLEKSLNLQNARIAVFVDLMLNPARVKQVLGRVRRVGSRHRRVYPFRLLTADTQEEQYPEILLQRQAQTDMAWGDDTDLIKGLSPVQLLRMMVGG